MSEIIVDDYFRRNLLSLAPGGCTLSIEYSDKNTYTYDKVKNPVAYINQTFRNNGRPISKIYVEKTLVYDFEKEINPWNFNINK